MCGLERSECSARRHDLSTPPDTREFTKVTDLLNITLHNIYRRNEPLGRRLTIWPNFCLRVYPTGHKYVKIAGLNDWGSSWPTYSPLPKCIQWVQNRMRKTFLVLPQPDYIWVGMIWLLMSKDGADLPAMSSRRIKGVISWPKVSSLVFRFWRLSWTNKPNTRRKWKLRYSPIQWAYLEPLAMHFSDRRCSRIGFKTGN